MKDITGTEVKIGDRVVHYTQGGLKIGNVVALKYRNSKYPYNSGEYARVVPEKDETRVKYTYIHTGLPDRYGYRTPTRTSELIPIKFRDVRDEANILILSVDNE